ncbi:ribonuclease HII [Halomonas denitrificans]|nr:ribonuclease HII [Halomonas denitrificans]
MKAATVIRRIAGVDEAGRGPLAGPVVAAAVVLHPDRPIDGLDDSKKLTARRRDELFECIRERAAAFAIVEVGPADIDRLNILQATMTAMAQAVRALDPAPDHVRIDGNRLPDLGGMSCEALVGGDGLCKAIGAASILAKVHRDRLMIDYHARWPDYGFDRHKGYPTAAHLAALDRLGPTPIHRRSFRPVRQQELF